MLDILRRVPWKTVKRILDRIRRMRPVSWPSSPGSIVLEESHDAFERRLRDRYFEGTPYTLKYEGEVVNLRRPAGLNGDGRVMELHVRSRDHDDGIEILAHREQSRYEEKTGHVHEDDLEWLTADELEDVFGRES